MTSLRSESLGSTFIVAREIGEEIETGFLTRAHTQDFLDTQGFNESAIVDVCNIFYPCIVTMTNEDENSATYESGTKNTTVPEDGPTYFPPFIVNKGDSQLHNLLLDNSTVLTKQTVSGDLSDENLRTYGGEGLGSSGIIGARFMGLRLPILGVGKGKDEKGNYVGLSSDGIIETTNPSSWTAALIDIQYVPYHNRWISDPVESHMRVGLVYTSGTQPTMSRFQMICLDEIPMDSEGNINRDGLPYRDSTAVSGTLASGINPTLDNVSGQILDVVYPGYELPPLDGKTYVFISATRYYGTWYVQNIGCIDE